MKVLITKEHCHNADYMNTRDCPLFRAIKDQYPDFPLDFVGSVFVRTSDRRVGRFNLTAENRWNYFTMQKIVSGEIESFTVEIVVEYFN